MAVDYDVLELQLEGTAQMLSEARREITKLRAENAQLRALEDLVTRWACGTRSEVQVLHAVGIHEKCPASAKCGGA